MQPWELEEKVRSKESFIEFLRTMRSDWADRHELIRRKDGSEVKIKKEPWENSNVPDFLEAMEAWVEDSSTIPPDFDYKKMAAILWAATMYE